MRIHASSYFASKNFTEHLVSHHGNDQVVILHAEANILWVLMISFNFSLKVPVTQSCGIYFELYTLINSYYSCCHRNPTSWTNTQKVHGRMRKEEMWSLSIYYVTPAINLGPTKKLIIMMEIKVLEWKRWECWNAESINMTVELWRSRRCWTLYSRIKEARASEQNIIQTPTETQFPIFKVVFVFLSSAQTLYMLSRGLKMRQCKSLQCYSNQRATSIGKAISKSTIA